MPSIGVAVEQLPDDLRRLDVVDRRAGLDDQPVGEGRLGERLDVVGDHVVAADQAGQGLARAVQRDRAARRRAEVDVGMGARAVDQADDVVRERRVDVDLADRVLHAVQLFDRADDLLELLERVRPLLLVEDHDLLDRLGVAEPDPEHEPVELGLRQGERALVLDGVLGGDDEERVGHRVGRAVDRRLALLHRLEEGRLGLGRRPVDLVGEDDLGHDRARPELELLVLLVVDREAGHVRGQQVRRELDPPEAAAEAAGDGLREDRLAGAGHVLDQEVAAAEEGDEGEPDLVVLADDDVFDIGEDLLARLLQVRHQAPSGNRKRRLGHRGVAG